MELTPALIIQQNQEKPDKIYLIEMIKANIRSLCPLNQFSKVKSIVFSSNLIEVIPRGTFDKLKDLKELDISCNFISSLDGLVIPSLVRLVISFNRIETLEWISGYKNLQVLKAEGNKITSMKPLQPLGNLKLVNLSLNQISQIQGISATDIDELYLENNSIEQINPRDIRQTLKILFLKGNQLNDASFLENLKELETLNLDKNEFQTLESFSMLPNLNELYLSTNQIFMIGNKLELNELFPVLASLDLSNNSLYDRVELLCLRQLSTLRELNLQGNPCAEIENFEEIIMEDYPQLIILNDKQIARPTYLEELAKIKDTLKDEGFNTHPVLLQLCQSAKIW
ncbi:unnamed protein product [Blepharisma stoltei]|uniref:Uncharacterized protein n=1 Tax=Blepharisma stoltei TaxID=1481888 RepID=A0AAU9JPL8_9CILI|nr:unnamed protein product [Blepharisma stoltei]